VKLPGEEVTVKPVIALPPFDVGATKATLADELPAVATAPVGAPGTVAGVTAVEADEAAELPIAFVATTVKVYAVPFVKHVTFIGEVAPIPVKLPGEEVTV
jgi:hypothetical protein